jgi:ABC-type Fe3+ transport system permease subunit
MIEVIMTVPERAKVPRSERRDPEEVSLDQALELAFAPLNKRAFGTALGSAGALLMVLVTVAVLVTDRAHEFPLGLLGQYLYGYTVSWPGVLVGAGWGFVVAFVAGWFFAFCRNAALAITAFAIRTRAELTETRDFLDHI